MAAGIATLRECLKENFYSSLEKKTNQFISVLNTFAKKNKYPFKVFSIGSIFWFAFSEKVKIQTASDINPESMQKFNILFNDLLEKGIYFGPSGYEVGFISSAHTNELLAEAAEKICDSLKHIFDSQL